VTIGEGVSRIDDYAFYGCENLASVVVGDNVYRIGWQAFQNCSSLTTVFLGKSLRYIGASSFVDCPQLKDVYCYGDYSPSQSGGRIFKDDQLKDLTLHVPEACYDNYIFDGADNYPWQHFGKTETVTSTTVEKCAKPTISYENGTVSFACETEGVEFNSTVEYLEESFNNVSAFPAPSKFRVKVVAVKNGYLASEIAEEKFDLPSYVGVKTDGYEQGDENKDGKVNVADHVKLSNIMVDK
jgi:hypothetical protein